MDDHQSSHQDDIVELAAVGQLAVETSVDENADHFPTRRVIRSR